MPLRNAISRVGIFLCAVFLGLGYAAVNPWGALFVFFVVGSIWGFALWRHSTRLILSALLVSLAAAVVGLIAGALPLEMFFGVSFALAGWDLLLLERSLAGQEPSPGSDLLVRKHFQSLGFSIGIGSLIYLGGRLVQIAVPFGAILLLAILILLGVDRLWRMVSN